MELFLTAFALTLTPQIIFSMLGGLLGALISSDKKRYGWQLSTLFGIASLAMAASVGEYLTDTRGIESIWWLFTLNIPLGMIVGSTLDVLRITSPPLIERLVVGVGNSGVAIVVESSLNRLSKFLGVEPPDFTEGNIGTRSEVYYEEDAEDNKDEEVDVEKMTDEK